ncbi:glycosyltransferase [Bacillus salitolerans]|uniref:Glycosyltransferase n=1 Tax=Bacillus salitolerans TaxID=1437434 RepID=A0ABW4LQ11_9BACI
MIKRKIGIPIIGGKDWMGGVSYIELLVKALKSLPINEIPEIYLIVFYENKSNLSYFDRIFPIINGIINVGFEERGYAKSTNIPEIFVSNQDDLFNFIDFYYPSFKPLPNKCYASWIPDFQHKYLPEFFPKQELINRDKQDLKNSEFSKVIIFSSKDAEKDFKNFYPNSKSVTRILTFYSLPEDSWYSKSPTDTIRKYNLPNKFLICCNQFWAHKNHKVLFQAISILKNKGYSIPIVCTGNINDYRITNYFKGLQKMIKDLGIDEIVFILGNIPREDQIQLIRASQFLIQPSLFEGWSTVVEDARVLGKHMILSDLDVNIEQAPKNGYYFKKSDANDLSDKIEELLYKDNLGFNPRLEFEARQENLSLVNQFAKKFMDICETTIEQYRGMDNKVSVLKSVLIIFVDSRESIVESITYKSLQSHTNGHIKTQHVSNIDEIDVKHIKEDYFILIEEGYFFKKNGIETLLMNIGSYDFLVSGMDRTCLNGSTVFCEYFPMYKRACGQFFHEIIKPCILFKTSSFLDTQILNVEFLKDKKMAFFYDTPVTIDLSWYFNKRFAHLKEKQDVYLYSAGEHTEQIIKNVDLSDFNIRGIFDNNSSLEGKAIGGIPIFYSEHMKKHVIDSLIITSKAYEEEIFDFVRKRIPIENIYKMHFDF